MPSSNNTDPVNSTITQPPHEEKEMTPYETAVAGLAAALETELPLASDRLCDVEVDDRLIVLRPMGELEDALTMFTPVAKAPDDGAFSDAIKTRALSMNLFGADTLGGHLGLFAGSLILSAPPMDATALGAEAFAEHLLAFSRFAGEVEKKLAEQPATTADEAASVSPIGSGFISV